MRRLLTSGIFVVFCFLTVVILAQVPQLLNYQGRLTDDRGIPIITPTIVRFSLYQGGDAATPGSGTLCYREDASVTPDDNGVFSHLVGSGTVIYGALDSTVFQTADPVYLEITIDPAGANETLLPRKQIVTVGYSFKSELADDADTVDGQDASAFAPVVHNHDPDYVNEGQTDSVTSTMIADGTIVDADINAGANIAGSKIDPTGLDADLLDGVHSTGFVSTSGDDMTGTLYIVTSSQTALMGKTSHTNGAGVFGEDTATSGITTGVWGRTWSSSGHAAGVFGEALADSGATFGVYAESRSPAGRAVFGSAPNSGVCGEATATSGFTYGVFGKSNSPGGSGVYGMAPNNGVYGDATASSGTTYGLRGRSRSPSGFGVYGENPVGGWAGYFDGKVHVTGDFTTGGAKTCVQPIDNGKKVLLYAMESPEIWFEDFGTAQLVNGQAVVAIEKVFAQTANIEMGYLIFLTPIGECQGLYISRKDNNSFEVRELGGGTSSISFDYRIVAKRRGYEEVRFEEFTEPEQPPAEPNIPVEKK